MENLSPVILSICGFSLVCLGLITVGAFIALRFTRGGIIFSLFEGLGGIFSNQGDEEELDVENPYKKRVAPTEEELRAKKQSLDFDEAVKKYRGEDVEPSGYIDKSPPETGQNSSFDKSRYGVRDTTGSPGRRLRDRRYRRNAADQEDELFNYEEGEEDIF